MSHVDQRLGGRVSSAMIVGIGAGSWELAVHPHGCEVVAQDGGLDLLRDVVDVVEDQAVGPALAKHGRQRTLTTQVIVCETGHGQMVAVPAQPTLQSVEQSRIPHAAMADGARNHGETAEAPCADRHRTGMTPVAQLSSDRFHPRPGVGVVATATST